MRQPAEAPQQDIGGGGAVLLALAVFTFSGVARNEFSRERLNTGRWPPSLAGART